MKSPLPRLGGSWRVWNVPWSGGEGERGVRTSRANGRGIVTYLMRIERELSVSDGESIHDVPGQGCEEEEGKW